MSLTSALGAARAGLETESIRANLIARNISNADTKGYSRKSADVITLAGGGSVAIGIDRQVDSMLTKLDRANQSKLSMQQTVADGMRAYTDHLGQPNDESSPSAGMARLKSAFVALSMGVSDLSAQIATVTAARELAEGLRTLSGVVSDVSDEVEMNIRYDVSELNKSLYEIAKLNGKLLSEPEGTEARTDLEDKMDILLDKVSSIVDVQIVVSNRGMVSVLTSGGVELVSERDVNDVVYDSVTGSLSAGDARMTPGTGDRSFSSGSLAGLFQLKNNVLPNWQGQLDTMAAALVEGFERVAPINGGAGLFTDEASGFNPAAIDGLASRITINAAVDPDVGGDPRLLQSGGDAARPVGDSTLIDAMVRLFEQPTVIAGREFGESPGLIKMASGIVAAQQKDRSLAETAVTTTTSTAHTISASRENLRGVNVDDELQNLLVIERSYAANSKVLTSVTAMLDSLLQAV